MRYIPGSEKEIYTTIKVGNITAEYWRRFFNGFKTKKYYENRN